MRTAILLLGSNLGDRLALLKKARQELATQFPGHITASRIYQTPPFGVTEQPAFLNQALAFLTACQPLELLQTCHSVESLVGRTPSFHWGPREIDIDILCLGDLQMHLPALTLPHPGLAKRQFALVPLAAIHPNLPIPGTGRTVEQLLRDLRGQEGNLDINPVAVAQEAGCL